MEPLEIALRGNRMNLKADILRRKAKEARELAESLERLADSIDDEFPRDTA